MPIVAIVNRKGGSGKSTLATHLAAYCARRGLQVMLGDVDRQQSSQTWLKIREAEALAQGARIVGWAVDPKSVLRIPPGVSHVVLDTPGGMHGFELARIVMHADAILMPVCNSVFDRAAAADCLAELKALPRVTQGRCRVAAIGMRVNAQSDGAAALAQWAQGLNLPFIGVLGETQAYVRCVERGLTLFDLPREEVHPDLAQWESILQWLGPILQPATVTPIAAAAAARQAQARQTPQVVAPQFTSQIPSRAHTPEPAVATAGAQIPRFLQRGS